MMEKPLTLTQVRELTRIKRGSYAEGWNDCIELMEKVLKETGYQEDDAIMRIFRIRVESKRMVDW